MYRLRAPILAGVVAVLLLVPLSGQSQRRPDFSGHWVLVEALTTGASRDSSATPAGKRGRPTTSNTISGAAFNCGRGCTIGQKGQALTIDKAQLAGYEGKDESRPTPAVTFRLDGREAPVVDTFNPHMTLTVTAKWDGNKVRIDSRTVSSSITTTQVLSLESTQLIVVSAAHRGGESLSELSLKYRKK